MRVAGHDGQPFGLRLADHQAVKWIAVVLRQSDERTIVFETRGQRLASIRIEHAGEKSRRNPSGGAACRATA